jgi:hypothetical protein
MREGRKISFTDNNLFNVYGAVIRILEEKYKIDLYNLLQNFKNGKLESKIGFKIEGYLTNEFLKEKFTNKKFRKFLISANLL